MSKIKKDEAADDMPELDLDETMPETAPEYHEFTFESLSKGLQDFINNMPLRNKTRLRIPVFFGLLHKNPNMTATDLCLKSGIRRPTYCRLLENKAFAEQIQIFKRIRIADDVKNSYDRLIKLINSPDEKIAFAAVKFMLENNGQEFGFGKKDDNSGVLKIEIEDKRTDKPVYTDDELADI
jgi:hypothetical protein